jgi:hypothetical protein
VAEAIDICARSQPLRAELRARGERRLAEWAPERTEAALRGLVEPLV